MAEQKTETLTNPKNTSPTAHLDAKIQQVELRMRPIARTKKGYGYMYATLTDLLAHVTPALKELDLMWTASSNLMVYGDQVCCICKTEIVDMATGESRQSVHAYPLQADAQKVGSYETYFRRYSLISLLGLPIQDDDGQATVQRWPVNRYQREARK